jgi:hypothetical protein
MAVTNYYYLNIFLKNTYKNTGQVETVGDKSSIKGTIDFTAFTFSQASQNTTNQTSFLPPKRSIIFTGITKSRLDEVKTYNPLVPFKLNVNGVTKITPDFIEYNINGILYTTYLSNNLTVYKVTKQTNELDVQRIIGNNNSVFIDIKKTLNALIIERSNVSVYNYFNKINGCDELDDILDIF